MDENKTRADLPDEELDSVSGGKAILPPGISVRDGIPYVCDKCGYEATLRFDPYAAQLGKLAHPQDMHDACGGKTGICTDGRMVPARSKL